MDINKNMHQPKLNFGALKKIQFENFNVNEIPEYSGVVNSFKENKALNELLSKHDGIATFDSFFGQDKLDHTRVTIRYANSKPNSFKKILSKLFSFNEFNKYDRVITVSAKDYFSSWSAEKLKKQINEINFENINKLIKKV